MTHGPADERLCIEAAGVNMVEEVGAEVRRLRKARGMTLAELSRRAGLSTGFISQAERGISTLTVKALQDVSRALGVPISWFFQHGEPPPRDERDVIVRANRRRAINYGRLGIVDQLLSPHLNGPLELLLCHLAPGASSGEASYQHEGEEAGLVLTGTLELWVGERHFRLGPGDSFTYPSTIPHRYRNPGEIETIVVWAITPPSF